MTKLIAGVLCLLLVCRANGATTQPSIGDARAAVLKGAIKDFVLSLDYYGPSDKPYYRLILGVAELHVDDTMPGPFVLPVQINADQAQKIIDHLLADGTLAKAVDVQKSPIKPDQTQQGYLLTVSAGGSVFGLDLGWGRDLNEKLIGLRKVLDGDAAKKMDVLLGRLGIDPKKLVDAVATQPYPAEAVVKDGLQVTVTLPKNSLGPDEAVKYVVHFKNVSQEAFSLYNANMFWEWKNQFQLRDKSGPWQLRETFLGMRGMKPTVQVLKPEDTIDVPAEVDPAKKFFEYEWEGDQGREIAPVRQLPGGSYELTIRISLAQGPEAKEANTKYWIGELTTKPVTLEIQSPKPRAGDSKH